MDQYVWAITPTVVVSLFFVGSVFRTARFRRGRHLNELTKGIIVVDHFNKKQQPMVRVTSSCSSCQRKSSFPLFGTERIHLQRGSSYHVCIANDGVSNYLVKVLCAA